MWNTRFTRYLAPMLLLFVILATVYYINFDNIVGIIRLEHEAKVDLIEQSLYSEIAYTEIVNQMIETTIHDTMERYSRELLDRYRLDPEVSQWDLQALKGQFDGMDIYAIDKNLTIVASTVDEETGFEFSAYPRYAALLTERLRSDRFEADAINFSIHAGELKTFSYIPTPDHEYLLELGVNIKDLYPDLEHLNVSNLTGYMKGKSPFVEDINVYRFEGANNNVLKVGRTREMSIPYQSLPIEQEKYIKRASETGEIFRETFLYEDNQYTLQYVPFEHLTNEPRMTWWRPYVLEILFNDQSMMDVIAHQKEVYVYSFGLTALLYFGLFFALYYGVNKMRAMVLTDYLTKLPNRKRFEEELKCKLKAMSRHQETNLAVFFIDLDDFKAINDTHGHAFGDKLLQQVAKRMTMRKEKNCFLARLGGDEFVGFAEGLKSRSEVERSAEHLRRIFSYPFVVDSLRIRIKVSIGVSIYLDHTKTAEQLVQQADQAMYQAKQDGLAYVIFKGNSDQAAFTAEE